MAELRLIRDEDATQCMQVANSVFRTSGQKAMEEAFPTLYTKGLGQSFGVFEEGRLVSFLGMMPHVIRIGEARLNALSVGSVCTLEEARGNGYASRLFALAKEHAASSDASLVLVSGDRPLYTKADCYKFGSIRRYVLHNEQVRQTREYAAGTIREWAPTDLFQLAEVARTRLVRYEQSIGELAMRIAAEGAGRRKRMAYKVLVATSSSGDICAFAVIAIPPPDLPDEAAVAVEWAGDPALTAEIMAHAVRVWNLRELQAPVNWHEQALIGCLDEQGYPYSASGNVGTVHIVNAQRLFKQLAPYCQRLGKEPSRLVCERMANGDYRIGGLGDVKETLQLQPEELVALLFDPEASNAVDDPLRKALAAQLLTPFPYTGGLNYF